MNTKEKIIKEYGDLYIYLEPYLYEDGSFSLSNLESEVFDLIEDLELVKLGNGLSILKSIYNV